MSEQSNQETIAIALAALCSAPWAADIEAMGLRTAAGSVLLATLALPSAAAPQWRCTLSNDLVQLVCTAAEPEAALAETVASVNGTRFPLDTRRRWVVDLWSPPTEMASLEHLARATVCYRTPGCQVQVDVPHLASARR